MTTPPLKPAYQWMMEWGWLPKCHELTILRCGKIQHADNNGSGDRLRMMEIFLAEDMRSEDYSHIVDLNIPQTEAGLRNWLAQGTTQPEDYITACENAATVLQEVERYVRKVNAQAKVSPISHDLPDEQKLTLQRYIAVGEGYDADTPHMVAKFWYLVDNADNRHHRTMRALIDGRKPPTASVDEACALFAKLLDAIETPTP